MEFTASEKLSIHLATHLFFITLKCIIFKIVRLLLRGLYMGIYFWGATPHTWLGALHKLFDLSLRKPLCRQELLTLFLLFRKLAHRVQSWGGIVSEGEVFSCYVLPFPNILPGTVLSFSVTWLVPSYSWYL